MMERRELLGGAAGALAFLAGRSLALASPVATGTTEEAFRRRLTQTAAGLRLSPALGQEYLTRTTRGRFERDVEGLSRGVRQSLPQGTPVAGRHDLMDALAAAVKRDFQDGRICYVGGWYLSLTECRLAALKHLAGGAAAGTDRLAQLRTQEIRQIVDWGPQTVEHGAPFDSPSGDLVFWILGAGEHGVSVFLEDIELRTTVYSDRVTAALPFETASRVVNRAGTYRLWLVAWALRTKQKVGDFVVGAP